MRVNQLIHAQLDNVNLLNGVITIARSASKVYGISFQRAFYRAMLLVRQYRFKPQEAYDWGLMNPAIEESVLPGYLSKQAMSRFQNGLNPLSWYYTTEDKSIFYRICEQQSIPIPKLYGVAFRNNPGWITNNRIALRPQDWLDTLGSVTEHGIVIKPSRSLFGRGVEVYSKEGDQFANSDGLQYQPLKLAERLCSEKAYDSLIVQERLRNHVAFAAIGRIEYLQTLRILTFVDTEGEPKVLAGFLKLIRGTNSTDNWDGGRSGNLILRLDLSNGHPVEALHNDSKFGTVKSSAWTDFCKLDGELKADFSVPFWEEVLSLSKKLALAFLPLRTVGWDLAVTDGGVSVLEGNYRAGPYPTPELHRLMQPAIDAMQDMEKAHGR